MLPSQFLNVVLEEKEVVGEDFDFNKWDSKNCINNNNVLENWELTTKLPEALLSECTVEICRRPNEKKVTPKLRFEARVTPIYGSEPKKIKREKTTILQDGTKIEEQVCVVQDILSEVEAVYSEESDGETRGVEERRASLVRPHHQPQPQPQPQPQSYQCDHCPNSYSNRGALWQHSVASHSLQKNCECGICGRRFYRNCSLALHLKSHAAEEEGLSSCKECGKEFTKASTLEKHMKIHQGTAGESESGEGGAQSKCSGEEVGRLHVSGVSSGAGAPQLPSRPHRCVYCGKAYSQKSVLKKHLVIHTGERLTCALCGIDFTQKSSLLRHMKRMHCYEKESGAPHIKIPHGISISMVD